MDKYFRVSEKVNGYSIHKLLGEGRYGIAYLAINDKYEKCVVKQLKNEMLEQSLGKLFYEEQILRSLNNPKFPKFISRFKDNNREGYLLEYIEGYVFGDLVRNSSPLSKDRICIIGYQLLDLVELLQKNNIVHRDIRLPNVIVKPNRELALIDFGLSRFIDNDRYVKQMDYWYIGDFLIFLYYTSYKYTHSKERPWFEELDLSFDELMLLKKLMGLEPPYQTIYEIKKQLSRIKNTI